MESSLLSSGLFDRAALVNAYRRNRARSRRLFDLLAPDAYYSQPIALRHPIVFYEGHLPGFSFNTLVKKGLGDPSIDPQLEQLFARGIDPSDEAASGGKQYEWPARATVHAFADEADRRVIEAVQHASIDRPGHPLLDRAEAVFAILEHEAMHQETLLYMWHRLPFEKKARPAGYVPRRTGSVPAQEWIEIAPGRATLGTDRNAVAFSWDNERPSHGQQVEAFAVDRHNVTNDAYLEFVEAGGYTDERWWRPEDFAWVQREQVRHPQFWERHGDRWYWRGMFELIELPLSWPVYTSFAEAAAFARWRGARLPSEAEFQRAAYGTPDGHERRFPWGDVEPAPAHGVFNFSSWDPEPAGSHPQGRSAWGVEDLVGNGWEWTSSPFAPFPGFQPIPSYPEYSADFFDGDHFVMKGASPATATELIRPTFRNWFRAHYPYVYATFRCARPAAGA